MKPSPLLRHALAAFVWLAARASAQADPAPLDGTLVRCGADTVVVVAGTASSDGRHAAGWTIRPKDGQPAVDWSAYRRDDPQATVSKYHLNDNPGEDGDDPAKSPYVLLNGVLDLRARKFVPLASGSPFFPYRRHASLAAAWSDERDGTHYAVLANNSGGRESEQTEDLSLVRLGPGAARVTDLRPAADEAVRGFLRRRDPKDCRRYVWSFDFLAIGAHSEATLVPFKNGALTIHFSANIPGEPNNLDVGYVTFMLPEGKVAGTVGDDAERRRLLR